MLIGLILRGIGAARRKGRDHIVPCVAGRFFNSGATAEHDKISHRHFFAAGLRGVKGVLDSFQCFQHMGELGGLVHFPVFLRCQTDARAIRATAFVRAAEGGGRGPCGADQLGNRQTGGENSVFQRGDIGGVNQGMRDFGDRVLPQQHFVGDKRPEIAHARAHVAVGQLVPGAGKGIGELIGVFVETPGDGRIIRIDLHRDVGGGHERRVSQRRVMGVGHGACHRPILGGPLMRTGRAFYQFPFVAKQGVEIAIVPSDRIRCPCAFQPAADGVNADA